MPIGLSSVGRAQPGRRQPTSEYESPLLVRLIDGPDKPQAVGLQDEELLDVGQLRCAGAHDDCNVEAEHRCIIIYIPTAYRYGRLGTDGTVHGSGQPATVVEGRTAITAMTAESVHRLPN